MVSTSALLDEALPSTLSHQAVRDTGSNSPGGPPMVEPARLIL
jgi:hypothetical protein